MANPYPETRVAAVAAINAAGKLLLGLRNDVNLWTCPGGHLEDGEQPARGAIRELYEETGLTPKSLEFIGDGICVMPGKVIRVYCFRAEIPAGQEPTGANDPDAECSQFQWVDVALGSLPLQYDRYMYHPNDVLLRFLGLQRGVIREDVEDFAPTDDHVKVILEQSGMAPCPIEGNPGFVFTQLLRRFPGLEKAAEHGDVEGLACAINESGAAYVAFGDELNDPRHRYMHEEYDPAIHDDPWPREADVTATTGLRKDDEELPHPFDYSKVAPGFSQEEGQKPTYEYKSASHAQKAKFWSQYHSDTAQKLAHITPVAKDHEKLANLHAKNAIHLATAPKQPLFQLQHSPKPPGKPQNPWDHTAGEDLPHPFRYENAPPGEPKGLYAYGDEEHHTKALLWAKYHATAAQQASALGQEGQAEKHKAQEALHRENLEYLKPSCETCGSKDHNSDDHPSCGYCGSEDHASEDHTDDDSDEHDPDSKIGWRGESRGDNKPTGPLGEQVLKQIEAHGKPQLYDSKNIPGGKYSSMDRAITRKMDDGAVHTDDLYRSYKHTPHIGPSLLLKYIVNRVNHMQDYDDPGKAERLDKDFMALHQFGGAKEKNGHINIRHLHHMLQSNPHLVDELVAKRDAHQEAIRNGVGLNVRKINGQDYVALTRGLGSATMNHEHALSSFADIPTPSFGSHKHHVWVPLKDVWYSYDLGSRYPKGHHGAEDEFLVSHHPGVHGHRYKATPQDVQPNTFKGDENHGPLGGMTKEGVAADGSVHWEDVVPSKGMDKAKFAPALLNSTDTDLAHHVEHHAAKQNSLLRYGGPGAKILNHPNAGPETWAAMSRHAFEKNDGVVPAHWLGSRAVPADAALAHLARAQATSPQDFMEHAHEVIKNPNLSPEQTNLVLGMADSPERLMAMVRSASQRSNLPPEQAKTLFDRLDQNVTTHSIMDFDANSAASDLIEKMSPADRTATLMAIAKRKFSNKKEMERENHWNTRLASKLMDHVSPEDCRAFVDKVKASKTVSEKHSWAGRIYAKAPPSDAEVQDYAKLGNSHSNVLERKMTESQLSHVLKHGETSAARGLVSKYLSQHRYDETWILSPERQKELLDRPDFSVAELAKLPGMTSETLTKLLEKNKSPSVSGADRVLNLKFIAQNEHLDDKAIVGALPPSAKERLPFIFEKPFRLLSSYERRKVSAYKKDHPETKDIWDLLVTRGRQPKQPKGHIIKPLPAGERVARPLSKALPGFKFPKMGVKDDRRETPILADEGQINTKLRAIGNAGLKSRLFGPSTKAPGQDHGMTWDTVDIPQARRELQAMTVRGGQQNMGTSAVIGPSSISYSKANSLRTGPHSDKSDVATKLHEDFHNVFKQVQNRYGVEGRRNLARNLMSKLYYSDKEAHDALNTYFRVKMGPKALGQPLATEEHFTHLLNYLNDPADRAGFHGYHFGTSDYSSGEGLKFNNALKRAYKASLKHALQADSTWALRPSDRSAAEYDKLLPE